MRPMSRAPVDAPAETAAELPTATEAALLEMVLGLPGVGPRLLGRRMGGRLRWLWQGARTSGRERA
ncbi:hypothetical protein [Sorangium sp. So ce1097]|uniref:hypothetical protein n=1 Tax=Sorangium sp. So ce1097 TaxID=3133330 RepID=UPI003F60C9BF